MSARRAKWHPPPPPTPRILHLPRRSSRRSRLSATTATARRQALPPPARLARSPPQHIGNPCGSLEALFDQERSFNRDRRARVESRSPSPSWQAPRRGWASHGGSEDDRWRLEAEMLRAECNFLRMEREVTLQKLESSRVQMEAALRSAVQTLVSGRKKMDGQLGLGAVLQQEIEELQSKLELLHRCSRKHRSRRRCTSVDSRVRKKSSGSNFDRKALLLRRRLEEMTVKVTKTTSRRYEDEEEEEEETFVREIREIVSGAISVSAEKEKHPTDVDDAEVEMQGGLVQDWRCRLHDVEILRRKMEGMSKVMLQGMESYNSSLPPSSSSSSSSGAANAAIAANRRAGSPRAARAQLQGTVEIVEDGNGLCSGRCRELVGRVAEQVRAEADQWNKMQGMLEQVRREMEDLQCSRDFWERCAVASESKLRAATFQLLEWRQKAQASEQRVSELQMQVRELQVDVESLRRGFSHHLARLPHSAPAAATSPSPSRPRPPLCSMDPPRRIKCHHSPLPEPEAHPQPLPLPPQHPPQQRQLHLAKEKQVQVPLPRSKENHPASRMPRSLQPRRAPLQEIGNVSVFSCRT